MSNQGLDNRTYMLRLASIVGFITQRQYRGEQYRGEPDQQKQKLLARSSIQEHLGKLVEAGHLEERPGRHYYARSSGRPSPIYQLTGEGANWLVSKGFEAKASKLEDERDIKHALAVLDVRLKLYRFKKYFKYLYTDKEVSYGETDIRPD